MYFVDRHKLEDCIEYMARLQDVLEDFKQMPEEPIQILAFERAIHMQIEALLDIANHMIDGFIMRDPGSYEDIIMILTDEQVISEQDKEALLPFIQCRRELVTNYINPEYPKIWEVYQQAKVSLQAFPPKVREYLDQHLGPVSAFIPVSKDKHKEG